MKEGAITGEIFSDGQAIFVTCSDCGNEQGDMGKNITCEECGASMPTAADLDEDIRREWDLDADGFY